MAGLLLAFTACGHPARTGPKQTEESASRLYRDYALHALSNRNVLAEYVLTERPIPGLWNAVGAQAFSVGERIKGQIVWRDPVFCVAGKILPFGSSAGGVGVMSAVVQGDAFYYTYAFGSGIHRSHVGRLRLVDGEPQQHESAPFPQDLFVEKAGDGVRVVQATYREFNAWENGVEHGRIDPAEKYRLRIIDAHGAEVVPGPRRE